MNGIKMEPPTDADAKDLCLIGMGASTCRYLTISGEGWSCEKFTALRARIDAKVAAGEFTAMAINCSGKGSR